MRDYLLSVLKYFSNELSYSCQKAKRPLQLQDTPDEIVSIREAGVQITVIMRIHGGSRCLAWKRCSFRLRRLGEIQCFIKTCNFSSPELGQWPVITHLWIQADKTKWTSSQRHKGKSDDEVFIRFRNDDLKQSWSSGHCPEETLWTSQPSGGQLENRVVKPLSILSLWTLPLIDNTQY